MLWPRKVLLSLRTASTHLRAGSDRAAESASKRRSDAAVLKFPLEPFLGQPPSDEHETAVALFIRLPRTLGTAFEKHVHALDHEALVVLLHRNDALHSKDVCSEILRNLLNPGNEPRRIERAVGGKGQTADPLIVFMVVCFGEKPRFDLENAAEIKGIAAEHFGEIDTAAFGAMDAGIRIDSANARFDRGEIIPGDQIGLVEQHDIGETKLLLRLRGSIDLAEKVLGVDHRHDGIELGLAADVIVDKKRLRDGCRIGQ